MDSAHRNSLIELSFEFFPPKDQPGEDRLWQELTHLRSLSPSFVSVTYGAGGSTRERTIRVTEEIGARTGLETVAHLTCVGSTKAELADVLDSYKRAGINQVLALRGDPVGGPLATWEPTPGGFDHADQLVKLVAEKGLGVGVAAFPDLHPASNGNAELDLETLLRKEEFGATFAISQFFFEVSSWERLVNKLENAGSKLKLIPGVMPVTNVKQLVKFAQLSGTQIPDKTRARFEAVAEDEKAVRALGVEVASELCAQLLAFGCNSLHFYTMNTAEATVKVCQNLDLGK